MRIGKVNIIQKIKKKIKSKPSGTSEESLENRIQFNSIAFYLSQNLDQKKNIKTYRRCDGSRLGGNKYIQHYPKDYFIKKYISPYPDYTSFLQNKKAVYPKELPKTLPLRHNQCGATFENI